MIDKFKNYKLNKFLTLIEFVMMINFKIQHKTYLCLIMNEKYINVHAIPQL